MIDTEKLKNIITRCNLSQREVAQAIGLSEKNFQSKLRRGVFGSDEIEMMAQLLCMEHPEDIFFAKFGT